MKRKSGEGCIEICIFTVIFCIILSVMISFISTVEIIRQTKRNSRVVLDSFVMNNSVDIYDSLKQGEDTVEILDTEKFISDFCSFNSLQKGTDCLIYTDEHGNKEYSLSKPQMEFTSENRMKIKISYTVNVPLTFAGIKIAEANVPIAVTSNYDKKF